MPVLKLFKINIHPPGQLQGNAVGEQQKLLFKKAAHRLNRNPAILKFALGADHAGEFRLS